MEIPAWLPRAAAVDPDRCALETPAGSLTYAELLAHADRGARVLSARGAGPGDRVAIALEPGLAFVEAFWACLRLGAVAVPVDTRLGEHERGAQTRGADVIVDAPLEGPEAEAPLVDTHALDGVATVMHTSGTSGTPRPVALTFGNWLWSALGSAVALGLDPCERWLCPLPLCHVGGLSILVRSTIYGTTAVVEPRFDAGAVADALAGERCTLVSLVPTTLARVLDAGLREPRALRCALIGGGPLSDEQVERAREARVPLAQTYGLTEACSQVTTSPIGAPQTAGHPLPATTVRLGPDREILVAGPTIAPAASAADGFLHTGDMGAIDERGRLTVTARKSDLIVTGGENVAPAEVESVLLAHGAVREAAVHGRPDPEWGEAVVATVVLCDGESVDAAALRAHCAARLAPFKVPKAVEFAQQLPRTAAGKLARRELV